jgi:hypothetical protein
LHPYLRHHLYPYLRHHLYPYLRHHLYPYLRHLLYASASASASASTRRAQYRVWQPLRHVGSRTLAPRSPRHPAPSRPAPCTPRPRPHTLSLGVARTPLHPSALCQTLTTGRSVPGSPQPSPPPAHTPRPHPSCAPRQVFTTAIFAVALLGRKLHTRKWLALLSLTLGGAACHMGMDMDMDMDMDMENLDMIYIWSQSTGPYFLYRRASCLYPGAELGLRFAGCKREAACPMQSLQAGWTDYDCTHHIQLYTHFGRRGAHLIRDQPRARHERCIGRIADRSLAPLQHRHARQSDAPLCSGRTRLLRSLN